MTLGTPIAEIKKEPPALSKNTLIPFREFLTLSSAYSEFLKISLKSKL